MKTYPTDSHEYYLIKTFKYLLNNRSINLDNKDRYNHKLKRFVNFRQLLDLMLSVDDNLRLAYELKELYTSFNCSCALQNTNDELEAVFSIRTIWWKPKKRPLRILFSIIGSINSGVGGIKSRKKQIEV